MRIQSLDYLEGAATRMFRGPGPVDELVRMELTDALNDGLQKLGSDEREALEALLRIHPQGYSCRTLAKKLGVSNTTISNCAIEAKRKVSAELEVFR